MEVVQKHSLLVDKEDCLRCSHLVHFASEKFNCTVENGNELCPAQCFTIAEGVNVDKAANDIVNAMKSSNTAKLAKYMQKLEKHHHTVKSQVLEEVQKRLAKLD